jgi:hypothetical protein
MHGGSAPQVRKSARERLAALADPAIGVLAIALKKAVETNDLSAAIRAAVAVLDRAGYNPRTSQLSLDLARLSDDQLARLAEGEDPLSVIAGGSGRLEEEGQRLRLVSGGGGEDDD